MNDEIQNGLDTEEVRFLENLTAVYKEKHERALIREEVARKVATTKFDKFSLFPNGSSQLFLNSIIIAVIIGTIALYFGFFNNNTNSRNDRKSKSSITSRQNNSKEKSKTVNFENKSNYDALNNTAASRQSSVDSINNVENEIDNSNKKMIVSSSDTSYNKKTYEAEINTGTLHISDNIPASTLESEIISILRKFEFKVKKNKGSDDKLNLRTNEVIGKSDNGNEVKYYINCVIERNNPDLLKIHLVHHKFDSELEKRSLNLTMENLFYDNVSKQIQAKVKEISTAKNEE